MSPLRALPYLLCLAATPAAAADTFWLGTSWGESDAALAKQLGPAATHLAPPLDFGDSTADLVLKDYKIGGYGFIVFFQMDKTTHGLKRIQIERGRHGAVPQVADAAFAALVDRYGPPTESCAMRAHTVGAQTLVEHIWRQGDTVMRALFRDASLNTLDPYLARGVGDFVYGSASIGLSQQLLIRIAPQGTERSDCVRGHSAIDAGDQGGTAPQ
jgi:hypothetical protein